MQPTLPSLSRWYHRTYFQPPTGDAQPTPSVRRQLTGVYLHALKIYPKYVHPIDRVVRNKFPLVVDLHNPHDKQAHATLAQRVTSPLDLTPRPQVARYQTHTQTTDNQVPDYRLQATRTHPYARDKDSRQSKYEYQVPNTKITDAQTPSRLPGSQLPGTRYQILQETGTQISSTQT